MNLKRTPAVILQTTDYGESDKIVTFYSAKTGKITGIAKGAKRSKKRFVNKLEIFSLLNISYAAKRGLLARIDQAELVNSFPALRLNYPLYTAASLLCELMLHWGRENDADDGLYRLLIWGLDNLNSGQDAVRIVILFQIKLFSLSGYRPHLAGCESCGRMDAAGVPYAFMLARGGLICRRCRAMDDKGRILLALNTAKVLNRALNLPCPKLDRLKFSSSSIKEAVSFVKAYGNHLLQREIRSWKFVEAERNFRWDRPKVLCL